MKEELLKQIVQKQEEMIQKLQSMVDSQQDYDRDYHEIWVELQSLERENDSEADKSKHPISDRDFTMTDKIEQEGLRCNDKCRWFKIGAGHCVWCIRSSDRNKNDVSCKDNWESIKQEPNIDIAEMSFNEHFEKQVPAFDNNCKADDDFVKAHEQPANDVIGFDVLKHNSDIAHLKTIEAVKKSFPYLL